MEQEDTNRMTICTRDGTAIFALPDNAVCKATGKSPESMDECPCAKGVYDRDMCIPEMCDEYEELTMNRRKD